ncbi:pilus assembly protein FimV [Ferrimonas sediminum]|uniref:Pilus assembly protein FimV n=1 Tax=Ferrimonas sediminum TaxID=718193 RepID=A0A1G8XWA7_9GAMM|nr:FimV/HubP family polar landmark protein [Ferrimonas sediminum]SDJ94767.1 pilus assembly protein FimV [Ferrimonas sediminum]
MACSYSLHAVGEGVAVAGPQGELKQVTIGPTSPSDTLWRLAKAHQPEGATVYQTMLALYQANPQAFSSQNLNALEKGMILTVPDDSVILAIDPAEAKARASSDDKRWSALPVAAKANVAPKPVGAQAPTPKQATTPGVDKELARLNDELNLQKQQSAEQIGRLRQELGHSIDEMAAMLEQNELLKARLDELNQQVLTLQSALDDQQAVNRELEQQLVSPMASANSAEVVEPAQDIEESGIWQQLWAKPWLVGIAAVVPTLFLLVLVWLYIRRRSPEPDGSIAQVSDPIQPSVPEPAVVVSAPASADSQDTAAIQLEPSATEAEEPVQSLEELLQEHQAMESGDAQASEPDFNDELLANMAINELEPDVDTVMSELGVALDDSADMVELMNDGDDGSMAMAEDDIEALLKDHSPVDSESQPEADEPALQAPLESEPVDSRLDLSVDNEPSLEMGKTGDEEFIDIDKLLDESHSDEAQVEPYNGLDLDIGDPDLTSLIGEPSGVDVDDEVSGYSAKLDLARAYIEIDDKDSAKALLREVIDKGAGAQQGEAQELLDRL